ncbi:MAG: class I SAM-dependent methyltransferase [Alphaproteobacteria bacterium]|nr:class I SAM-dependent methyltransferase [Alphaproteobacteria bacterium]
MFSYPDPALIAFLMHVHNSRGYFADIGAAYGYATLEALQYGGRVLAIDIDQRHLDVLLEKCPISHQSKVETLCGHFPNTIELPSNTFDGILLSRVLIFLKRKEIDLALTKIQTALKPGGIVYLAH